MNNTTPKTVVPQCARLSQVSIPVATERQPALDGIRGLAILAVLLFHCFYAMAARDSEVLPFWRLLSGGWLGVDLFFVLSGFLITGILIRSRGGTQYFYRFYLSRACRIFPAYFAVLGFVIFIYPAFNAPLAGSDVNQHGLYLGLFVQNWMTALGHGMSWPGLDHVWSLHIEEQFYLLWPLMVWLTPRQHLLRVCAVFWLLIQLCKFAALVSGASWAFLYTSTLTHADGLAAGAWVAAYRQSERAQPRSLWILAAGAMAAFDLALLFLIEGGLYLGSRRTVVLASSWASIAFGALIYLAVSRPSTSRLNVSLSSHWLVYLGQRSYSLYLIHWVLYWQIRLQIQEFAAPVVSHDVLIFLVGVSTLCLSLAVAELMYRFIEQPFLRMKTRWLGAKRLENAPPA